MLFGAAANDGVTPSANRVKKGMRSLEHTERSRVYNTKQKLPTMRVHASSRAAVTIKHSEPCVDWTMVSTFTAGVEDHISFHHICTSEAIVEVHGCSWHIVEHYRQHVCGQKKQTVTDTHSAMGSTVLEQKLLRCPLRPYHFLRCETGKPLPDPKLRTAFHTTQYHAQHC